MPLELSLGAQLIVKPMLIPPTKLVKSLVTALRSTLGMRLVTELEIPAGRGLGMLLG